MGRYYQVYLGKCEICHRRQATKWIWKEIEEMAQINFRFKQKAEASSTVSGLSSKLYKFDGLIPAKYLLSDSITRTFSPEAIKSMVSI